MLRFPALLSVIFSVALCASAFGQTPARRAPVAPAAKPDKLNEVPPMVFYIAKGAPGSCGEGCDTWIAAEGTFDWKSADRLRAFLQRIPAPGPPIYFSSPGGVQDRSLTIGRLLRARGMTAGVGQTIPTDCGEDHEKSESCRALKQSGKTLSAQLASAGTSCNSACVYALIGAKVRLVPPDILLGVHASKPVLIDASGKVRAARNDGFSEARQARFAKSLNELRQYVREMGIDTRLLDIAFRVPPHKVHALTRTEIASLGIDRREFQESSWTMSTSAPHAAVMKYFVDARGSRGNAVRTGIIQLACEKTTHFSIRYARAREANEAEASKKITVLLGSLKIPFSENAVTGKLDALDPKALFEMRYTHEVIATFENAAVASGFEIVESDIADSDRPARVTKLSTAGLSQSIAKLRETCR